MELQLRSTLTSSCTKSKILFSYTQKTVFLFHQKRKCGNGACNYPHFPKSQKGAPAPDGARISSRHSMMVIAPSCNTRPQAAIIPLGSSTNFLYNRTANNNVEDKIRRLENVTQVVAENSMQPTNKTQSLYGEMRNAKPPVDRRPSTIIKCNRLIAKSRSNARCGTT